MATTDSEFLEKINEEFLVCSICSERYRNARVLPCLHSFCDHCLHGWVEKTGKLDCPVCRRSHQLPRGGVANLQSNFFLDQLVEHFNQRDFRLSKSACDACLGEVGENDVRCLECSAKLCGNCASAHKRLATTRSHRLIAFDEYVRMKALKPSMVHASIICDSHADSQVKFYCDTCEVPICLDCTVIDHRSPEHKHRYLQDAAGEYKKFVEMTITQLKTKEKENDGSTQAVQKIVTKLDATFREEEKKLQDHMTETIKEIVKKIEENGRQLLKQLRDEYEARKGDLTAQLEAFDVIEHDLAYTREFTENLIRYGSDAQLMYAMRNIVAQTKQLLDIDTKCDPVAGEFMVFRPSDDCFEIKSLGKVQLTEYTLKDVPEFLRTGDDVCLNLQVKGREDVSVDKISSEIIDPTNKKETMTVEDHKNGTFSLRCRVKIEGDHKVIVSVYKQLVYSSYVKVIPKKGLLFKLGNMCAPKEGLNQPFGVTLDNKGNIVVCEKYKGAITRFSPFKDGFRRMAGTHSQYSEPYTPLYVAILADQNLHFVTEERNGRVLVFRENQKLIRGFKGRIISPTGIAVNHTNNRVYVADDVSNCIHMFYEDGDQIKSFGCEGSKRGKLKSPEGVCVNREGDVIVSDHGNNRVQVFDANGEFLFAFGDESDGQAQITCPWGVTTDKHNNVYVCDNGKQRVLKFDPKGNYICRIDNGEVSDPRDVCVTDDEPFGKVIVSDFDRNCIKVFAQ